MPKREDIHKIMLIGSGPIVIGQACEFDYSGTQACKALREEGYEIVLVNSNPATIMTDPEVADRTYVEPITAEAVARIIEKERPDALLPTLGGQTGLNTAVEVAENGTLEKYGVELIGAKLDVIKRAEERELFKAAMDDAGLESLRSMHVHTVEEAEKVVEELGLPLIVRPSFTLAGTGGGTARTMEELRSIVAGGLKASMTNEVLLEESIWGWKEFELELMRDRNDNVVVICAIENMDPMGIHTGDSITVAPSQTLSDVEYQKMRDWGIKVLRVIGVETGGSNVQFAINPRDGRMVVIEMNPRVSRSSALASKATGFPIAKIAAKLAVGYTLDEIPNDITRVTPACFEPTIDYTVVKVPRFAFEKFPGAENRLGISMKSVGETMAIGMNFKEALQKAIRGLESGLFGLDKKSETRVDMDRLDEQLRTPHTERLYTIKAALKKGYSIEKVQELTQFDPWFLDNILQIVELEQEILERGSVIGMDKELLHRAKRNGFSDRQIADLFPATTETQVRETRLNMGLRPGYRLVDTCAGEFEAYTPYYYSSYGSMQDEASPSDRRKIMILGSGPNRIGQGIEFDYCCVHTVMALRELGYETIMVNSNPETVSTDYDTSDKLFFEPLTFEDVMNIYESEKPEGVIVQMGGQTPLNLATPLLRAGVRVLGTSADSIDRAEDRERCRVLLDQLGLKQPESRTGKTPLEALEAARAIGFPVMIRPSYVLGGRAMMVAQNEEEAVPFIQAAFDASPDYPVLIDRYLAGAVEADVDVLCDGTRAYVGGIMEHVEAAGVHSGDSACATPPHTLPADMVDSIAQGCMSIAMELKVQGLLNVQIAVKDGEFYIIEINPRASRTVPYLSKATGVQLAKLAARVAVGQTLDELGLAGTQGPSISWCAVKEAVFPFNRFPGVDPGLGPEMKSTGEVMGIDFNFETAFWKSQIAAGQALPEGGTVFLSARDEDKLWMTDIAKQLVEIGFDITCTSGTAAAFAQEGIPFKALHKLAEETSPNVLEEMRDGKIVLVINTPSGIIARKDETRIRSEAISRKIPIITTESGARASLKSLAYIRKNGWTVRALQDYLA